MILRILLFSLLCFVSDGARAIELIGFSKDLSHSGHVFLEYSRYENSNKEQGSFENGNNIPGGFRVVGINSECVEISNSKIVSKECYMVKENIEPDKFSFVATNINAKLLIQQIARSLELAVIFDGTVTKEEVEKVEIYNINKENIFSSLMSILYKVGIKVKKKGDIFVFSKKDNLEKLLNMDSLYREMIKDIKSDSEPTVNLLESVSPNIFAEMVHRVTGVNISSKNTKKFGVNIFMETSTNSKGCIKLLLLSAGLMGREVARVNNEYIVE